MCCMGHRVNNLSVTLHNGRRLDLSWWSLCNAQEYYITVPGTWKSRSVVGQLCFKKDERKKRKKEEGEESSVYTVKCFYYTHTHTHARTRAGPCPDAHSAILLTYNLTYLRIS